MDPRVVPASELSVKTQIEPPTLKEKIKVGINTKDSKVKYTKEEKVVIEKLTRNQKDSIQWFKYRQGIVTSSNFNRVASNSKTVKKNGPNKATEALVETLVNGSTFRGNKATQYGLKQEPKAVSLYLKKMKEMHTGATIHSCGLFISSAHEYLGASPDRLFFCSCHGKRLVEVKCPYTLRDKSRTVQSLDFIKTDENGTLFLKTTGNSYFDQIQGQMGVTGIHKCDLVVFDGSRVEIIEVSFDSEYWLKLAEIVIEFHSRFVYTYMLNMFSEPTASSDACRIQVQTAVCAKTSKYRCGKCGQILSEIVTDDEEASINCECTCECRQWFHWKCVSYRPDPDLLDCEPPWYCVRCVQNCDIIM